jgi:hypothetical protein
MLAPRLAALGHADRALALARSIPRDRVEQRCRALAGVAGHLDPREREDTVREAFDAALRVPNPIGSGDRRHPHRAEALGEVVPLLTAFGPRKLHTLWRHAIGVLSAAPREEFFRDLAALGPVIVTLGGEDAIDRTCDEIERVGSWWP